MSEAALAGNPSNNWAMMNALTGGSSAGNANNINQAAEQLLQQYGQSNVQQSVNNVASQMISDLVMKMIDDMGMPDFMADQAREAVGAVIGQFSGETPAGLDDKVRELLGQQSSPAGNAATTSGSEVQSEVGGIMKQAAMNELESASEGSGGEGSNKNWLVVLARALGSAAGKHLKSMIELGEKMGAIDSTEDPEKFAQTQSEFQAASQIFKMFQEVIGTLIKSIGEGLSTVARKQ